MAKEKCSILIMGSGKINNGTNRSAKSGKNHVGEKKNTKHLGILEGYTINWAEMKIK